MLCGYTKKEGKQSYLGFHPLHKPIKRDPTASTTRYNFQNISHRKTKRLQIMIQPNSFCMETTRRVVIFSNVSFTRLKLHLTHMYVTWNQSQRPRNQGIQIDIYFCV